MYTTNKINIILGVAQGHIQYMYIVNQNTRVLGSIIHGLNLV